MEREPDKSEGREQRTENRRQRSEVGGRRTAWLLVISYWLLGYLGVVRTSVTLLGQDMGNTLLITVYSSQVDLQFYSGGYPPE